MFYTARKHKMQDSGFEFNSGKASGCTSRLNTRFRVAPGVLMSVSEVVDQGMRVVFDNVGNQDVECI